MAKKKADKKAEVVQAMPLAPQEALSITKDDFVNIAVAHREEQLLEEVANGEAEVRRLEKRRYRIIAELEANIDKAQQEKYSAAIEAANDALKKVGLSIQPRISSRFEIYPRDPILGAVCSDEEIEARVERGDKNLIMPHIFTYVDLFPGKGTSGDNLLRLYVESSFNEEQQKLVDEIVRLGAEIEALQEKVKDAKKLRKEIPHLERKAKAALSVHVLKQSDKGKAVLSALEDLTKRKLSLDLGSEPKMLSHDKKD